MRRGSLIGPLLLILIGGLFLVNNLRPEFPLLETLARYWPLVLAAWGALRLIEIFVWWLRDRPLPHTGISGGEWFLILLLTVIGSGVYATRHFLSRWPEGRIAMRGIEVFGEPYDFPLSAQRTAGKTPRVVIENLRGNARIVGAASEDVKVSGRKTIRAFRQSDANTANEQSPLEILVQGDRLIVRTNQDRISGEQRASADLDISVPRGSSIETRGRLGDFDISEIDGSVDVDSDNAGVRLNKIGGNARVDLRRSDIVRAVSVKGNVDIKGGRGQDVELENIEGQVTISGSFSGDQQFRNLAKPLRFDDSQTQLAVERIPGEIRMALGQVRADNVVGPMRLKTRSRDVDINDLTQSLDVTLERGDISLRPGKLPLAKLDVETHSGNIQLALPAAAKFEISAVTRRGAIENDYGDPLRLVSERIRNHDAGATLSGSVGQGPAIKLTTERGKIIVRKAAPPEPARPPAARASEPESPAAPPRSPAAPRLPVERQ